jgi:archaemetzincin
MKKAEKDLLDKTYGIFKFKVPSQTEINGALALSGESTVFKKVITYEMERFYDVISPPEEGDWLMKHKEYGQTYDEYIRNSVLPATPKKDVIYLVPLSYGDNISIDQGFLTGLLYICEAYFYGMKVKILDNKIDLKEKRVSVKMNYETNKIQFNANQIITILKKKLPLNAFCLISFTDQDLYSDNEEELKSQPDENKEDEILYNNTFCYGLTMFKQRLGVFSFARYDPLFYFKTPNENSESQKQKELLTKYFFILFKRACKVVVKEISHMFGLKNCVYYKCIMNGFNSIEEFDNRPFEICPVCLRKLYTNIILKTDKYINPRVQNPYIVFDRFVKLRDTLQEHFPVIFENEINWFSERVNSLQAEI